MAERIASSSSAAAIKELAAVSRFPLDAVSRFPATPGVTAVRDKAERPLLLICPQLTSR